MLQIVSLCQISLKKHFLKCPQKGKYNKKFATNETCPRPLLNYRKGG